MAEQIRVNGPNGLVVNFPAGTSPETINRVMQEAASGRGPAAPQMGQMEAAAQAARAGFQANLNDELAGLRAAGLAGMPGFVQRAVEQVPALSAVVAPNVGAARMAAERFFPQTFGSRATEAYAPARDIERAIDKAAEEQFPNTYLGANIAGSVATPLGFVGRGAKAAITAGGLSGATSGFGRGEGTEERLLGAATEGALGAGFGAIPGLAMGAFNAGQRVLAPQKFAERVVRRTIEADRARGLEDVLTPADIAAARAAGQDVVVGDLGATGTLRLSRAATNVSEDAAARLRAATDPRYVEQKGRFGDFIEGLFGGDLNLTSANDVLRDTARRVNAPLYRAAYQAGESADLWNPTLSRIAQAPSVQAAIRDVEKKAADRAVLEGDLVIRNPFSFDDQGRMIWGTTPDGGQIRPNLQFWDQVQRNLREAAEAAPPGSSAARDLKALRDRLNQELDTAVPEFGRARGMARQFFGAEDALEAGQTFFRQNRSIQLTDTQKAFRSMSEPERELFRRGFAAELANAVRNSRDSQDVAKLFDGANRRKLEVVMPTDELRQLEAFVRREAIMNRLRSATQGNSTTAQQLRDMSIGAGAGMGVGTFASGDPFTGAGTALVGGLLARGRIRVNENVMREVGEILSSSDPDRINKLLSGPNGNVIMNTLRKMSQAVGAGASNQPSTPPVRLTLNSPPPPALPPPGPPGPTGFAKGGSVKEPKMSPIVEAIIEEMGKRMAPEGARRAAAAAGYSRGGAVRKVAKALAERLVPDEPPASGGLATAREGDRVRPTMPEAPKNMLELPNLRVIPTADAVELAATGRHLIPSGNRSEGAFLGGPRAIQSMDDLARVRARLDAELAASPEGGDWYDRYRAAVREVTGDNPMDNRWMSNAEAQWSAGVSPEGELAFTLKENNAALAGKPVKSARPAQHEAFMRAIERNDPYAMQLGKKTGEYARRIYPDQGDFTTATGVNDFRHARNFEYTQTSGAAQREALGDAQHRFLDYETAAAVGRANDARLAGRDDWTGEQLQAALWVRQKAQDIFRQQPKLLKDRLKEVRTEQKAVEKAGRKVMTDKQMEAEAERRAFDDAFMLANKTIGDYFDKHTAFATYEAFPGSATGHLPKSASASQELRDQYSMDPRSAWNNAPGGRDAIYAGMRMYAPNGAPTGVAMRVRPSDTMQGVYANPEGVIETNIGGVARPLVAFDTGKVKTLPRGDRDILEAAEATRGYIDAQNASAAHKTFSGGAAADSNSIFLRTGRPSTVAEINAVREAAAPFGLTDIVDTGRGMTVTNFAGDQPVFQQGKKGALQTVLRAAPQAKRADRVNVDGIYVDYVQDWQKGMGSGAATDKLLGYVTKTPELKAALNRNPYIAQNALARMERDEEYARVLGATRKDIQNARRIIGKGEGWIDRLIAARKRGDLLPSVAGALVAAGAATGAVGSGPED